jgi:hypothetical protein
MRLSPPKIDPETLQHPRLELVFLFGACLRQEQGAEASQVFILVPVLAHSVEDVVKRAHASALLCGPPLYCRGLPRQAVPESSGSRLLRHGAGFVLGHEVAHVFGQPPLRRLDHAQKIPRGRAKPALDWQQDLVGKKPGADPKLDEWHARFGMFFKVAGPVSRAVGGLYLVLDSRR